MWVEEHVDKSGVIWLAAPAILIAHHVGLSPPKVVASAEIAARSGGYIARQLVGLVDQDLLAKSESLQAMWQTPVLQKWATGQSRSILPVLQDQP